MTTLVFPTAPEACTSSSAVSVEIRQKPTSLEGQNSMGRISCSACSAACCGEGVVLPLSPSEVEQLREAGTNLQPYDSAPDIVRRGFHLRRHQEQRKLYQLASHCGNLVEVDGVQSCGDYSNRPSVCRTLKVGGYACRSIRSKTGVDSAETFQSYLDATNC